jgi:hypothetical protein
MRFCKPMSTENLVTIKKIKTHVSLKMILIKVPSMMIMKILSHSEKFLGSVSFKLRGTRLAFSS